MRTASHRVSMTVRPDITVTEAVKRIRDYGFYQASKGATVPNGLDSLADYDITERLRIIEAMLFLSKVAYQGAWWKGYRRFHATQEELAL